ncbi:MAG: TPM domain-containing protein [Bacteroidetes bacterium]|nr:TPM domain-containing protein [Bacteroidota bacterium]
MSISASDFFTSEEQEDIKQAIMNSELDTSGEIRVHIESVCKGDVLDRASYVFHKLGMTKTAQRNGVMIYLAVRNRKFAIIGDKGIHNVVPPDFWDSIKSKMLDLFRDGKFCDGLILAITESGKQLKKYFPHSKDDINELPDDISFGKK